MNRQKPDPELDERNQWHRWWTHWWRDVFVQLLWYAGAAAVAGLLVWRIVRSLCRE